MKLVVNVPFNSILADVDESLRDLLSFELKQHNFGDVDISFATPSNEWSSQLSRPTVNLYLYDLRESLDRRRMQWDVHKTNGRTVESRPPLLMECSYVVTAWTQDIQEEHRLLSQVLAILHSYPNLPDDLVPKLATGTKFPLEGVVGVPREHGKADFWKSIQGQYKVSVEYMVTISLESGNIYERGPEVRTLTLRQGLSDGPRSTISETHAVGGKVIGSDGERIANAWVVLPQLGQWTASDQNGYFIFRLLPAGRHIYLVRAPDGQTSEGEIDAPGKKTNLVIGKKLEVIRKRKAHSKSSG